MFDVISWLFAVLLIWLSGAVVLESHSLLAAGIGLLAVTLCIPPVQRRLRASISIPRWIVAVVCLGLVGWEMSVGVAAADQREKLAEAKKLSDIAERAARARANTVAYFNDNKSSILAYIAANRDAGHLSDALGIVNNYLPLVNDSELVAAKRSIDLAQAKLDLPSEASLPLERRAAMFKLLSEEDPGNTELASKAKSLGDELAQEEALHKAEKDRLALIARRRSLIQANFSGFDGSMPKVAAEVKRHMKNPDSYEHVETRYVDTGERIVVITTYRGTNSFNAVVPTTERYEIDENGNVLRPIRY
jgi:hypothetical protein